MKNIIIIYLISISSICSAQTIDSVFVNFGIPVSTIEIKGHKPDMFLSDYTITPLNDINNTQIINLYFKGCALTQIITSFDTLISINTSSTFALQINTIWDTSINCTYPPYPLQMDSLYLNPGQVVGINNIEGLNNIYVYPNPTKDKISIESENNIKSISIYSLDGKQVLFKEIISNECLIDLYLIHQGIYYLKINLQNEKTIITKIIKE